MAREFVIVDVFTDAAFGGNQLAVLPDADGLSTDAMQAIAAEFGFSETTFVLAPTRPTSVAAVRIFTPRTELPFAGHPTVGTAAVLAALGRLRPGEPATVDEVVGPVTVVATPAADGAARATLRLERPELHLAPPVPARALAGALGTDERSVVDLFEAGVGVPFTFFQLPGVELLDALEPDQGRLAALDGPRGFFAFAGDPAGGRLDARMWAPLLGVPEDPATGSAVAALVAVVAVRAAGGGDAEVAVEVEQGRVLGRPSRLDASATVRGGVLESVTVGGGVVRVADGTLHVA